MKIQNKELDNSKVKQLIHDITQKKELQNLDTNFVRDELNVFFNQNPKHFIALSEKFNSKSALYKATVKGVRQKLRRLYGLFRNDIGKVRELIDSLFDSNEPERVVEEILQLHSSTKERNNIQFWKHIMKLTKNPKCILDLGCGLHPFTLWFVKNKNLKYYAYDLSKKEVSVLKKFFTYLHKLDAKFIGKAAVLDIQDTEKLNNLPQSDVAFLLKMTDVLDRGKGHKKTEEILKTIPAKQVVVSFSTKTMSGKKMTAPRRRWMEWLCKRVGYKYGMFELDNELFYVINKDR